MINSRLKKKAFTLVEALVAAVVLAIIALSVYSSMLLAKDTTYNMRLRERAMAMVSLRLEEAVKSPFRNVKDFGESYPSGRDETDKYQNIDAVTGLGDDEFDYTPRLTNLKLMTYVHDYGVSCKIVVVASWIDNKGELRSVRNHVFKYDDR